METKKIALFTSAGLIGQSIAIEAFSRGYKVTAIIGGDMKESDLEHPGITIVKGDVNRNEEVRRGVKNHDIVIFDEELKQNSEGECYNATRSVIMGCKDAGITRLIISGRIDIIDANLTKEDRDAWKPVQEEQIAALKLLEKESDIEWNYFYTIGTDLVRKSNKYVKGIGNGYIVLTPDKEGRMSVYEYAKTIIDEADKYENAESEAMAEMTSLT